MRMVVVGTVVPVAGAKLVVVVLVVTGIVVRVGLFAVGMRFVVVGEGIVDVDIVDCKRVVRYADPR